MAASVDNIIEQIGFGRWQLLGVAQGPLLQLFIGSQIISGALLNPHVPFQCLTPIPSNHTIYQHNSNDFNDHLKITTENSTDYLIGSCQEQEFSVPPKPGFPLDCQNVIFDNSTFASTFATEFNLVCNRSVYKTLYQSIFFIGSMVGSFLSGLISDRYGRRTPLRLGAFLNVFTVFSMIFATEIWQILTLRFLAGVGQFLSFLPSYCLSMEISPGKARPMVGISPGITYALNVITFSGLGYFMFRDWRDLFLASNIGCVFLIPLALLVDESPRWLVQNGRIEEAEKILTKAAKVNKSQLPEKAITIMLNEYSNTTQPKPKSLLEALKEIVSSFLMMRIILVTILIRMIIGMIYYGISFNASNFSKNNAFFYLALTGVVEMCVGVVVAPLCSMFKRRNFVSILFLIGTFFIGCELFIPHSYTVMRWACVMLGYSAIAIIFQVVYLSLPELFPTEIRGKGISIATLAGNIGSFLAPIVPDVMGSIWWAVPGIFGVSALVGGLLVWLLPETKDQPLLSTVKEFEDHVKLENEHKTNGKEGKFDQDMEQKV